MNSDSSISLATELLVASFTSDESIVFRNEAWQKLLGQSDSVWMCMPEEDRKMATRHVREAIDGTLVTNRIFLVDLPNRDQPLPLLMHFIPVPTAIAGKTTLRNSVTVTAEALAEPDSWVVSQTQRNRIENVGRMTLGLIHEINNMLTNILGNLEYMDKSGMLPADHPQLSNYLRTIQKAAADGAVMTRNVKQYVRNEKSSAFELLDLNELIRDCLSFTRPYWYNEPRRKGIEIDSIVKLQDIPPIMGSGVELKEVIINLITNAVQAMPRGGEIRFSSSFNPSTGITISISDTGNGMSETTRSRIFDPLFTTKGKHGTGMGLSISHSILKNHDANIDVESALGQGTTFIMRFKPVESQKPEMETAQVQTIDKIAHVLAVDDEPGVRNVLTNLLNLQGHSVQVAASGHEALDRLSRHAVDIVFTDHGMPGMNGRQLAQAIRQTHPELPIVLITGDTEFEDPYEDINAVIGKPFMLEDLQKAINELV